MKDRRNKLGIQEGQMETFHYEPAFIALTKKGIKRAAAYCRVSTLAEEQELSFDTQKEYYKQMIDNDSNMVLVGIYGDQGFSGLHAENRKEFQRLVADCEAGKVDVVLVKSISRFSRNTVECKEYLQILKAHGVAVLFEKEGLNSLDPQMEMILSIYCSMAQSESCSHSENIRWARKRRAELGDPVRGACFGYRIHKNICAPGNTWVIQEEEAETIRYLFSLAYQGYSTKEIREMVNERELNAGRTAWSPERVRFALVNEAYRGDILTSKTIVLDYLTKKTVKNNGQMEQYYLEEHHEPIVQPDVFDTIQDYIKQGYLNGHHTRIREAWLNNHSEILQRRKNNGEAVK